MARYFYIGQSTEGSISGYIEANSKSAANKKLTAKGYLIDQVKYSKKFNKKTFWNFIESLHALINENTSLAEAVFLLEAQENRTISKIAKQINSGILEGDDFMKTLEDVFHGIDKSIISLLRIGYENAGLNISLSLIISAKSQKDEILRETQKAIAYPAFVLLISIFVLIIIFDSVLPEFNAIISADSQSKLTQFILSFAGRGYESLIYAFWSILGLIFFYTIVSTFKTGKFIIDKVLNFTPFIGKVLRVKSKLIFLENISLALSLKSDLKEALKFSIQSINNQYHKTLLISLEHEILEGTSFEKALKATGIFNPMELLRIGLAEKSAKLPNTFKSLFNDNIRNYQKWINLLVQLLGPIAIIILGLIIFFVAFEVVTPMMSLQQSVG